MRRECIDPDDFTGRFAVWSGTSFAAPNVGAQIAAALLKHFDEHGVDDHKKARVKRGWDVVTSVAGIKPHH